MNSWSMCRELMDNNHRCGLLWGHPGAHQCCILHNKRPNTWNNNEENYE